MILIINACFLLHNFCLRGNEPCPARWVSDAMAEANRTALPLGNPSGSPPLQPINGNNVRAAGLALRNQIFQLNLHFPRC